MSDETWIWGRHPVLQAIEAGTVQHVILADGLAPTAVLRDIERAASAHSIPLRHVPLANIGKRAPGQNTQGVMALIRAVPAVDLHELLEQGLTSENPIFLLVLDEIQDPHNLGALIRSAAAAGVDGIVLPERRAAPLTGTVAKTSAGTISRVQITRVGNLARALDIIKQAGIWTVGLDGDADTALYSGDLAGPLALVVGGEARGLRRLTRDRCDVLVRIPMAPGVESLNASVAGSVALFEAVRQRQARVTVPGGLK